MDLYQIETSGFENASALVDVCRDELDRSGFIGQAEALRGIEVLDRSGAEVALMTLRNLPKASQDLEVLKRHLTRVLNDVIRQAAA
jgi:hypothetical protein